MITEFSCQYKTKNCYLYFSLSFIVGIKIINNLIISAGVDQRINLLSWNFHKKELLVNYITQYISVVADIHGIEVWQHSG